MSSDLPLSPLHYRSLFSARSNLQTYPCAIISYILETNELPVTLLSQSLSLLCFPLQESSFKELSTLHLHLLFSHFLLSPLWSAPLFHWIYYGPGPWCLTWQHTQASLLRSCLTCLINCSLIQLITFSFSNLLPPLDSRVPSSCFYCLSGCSFSVSPDVPSSVIGEP